MLSRKGCFHQLHNWYINNTSKTNFISLTENFIDPETTVQKIFTLTTKYFPDLNIGDNISEVLNEILAEWKIQQEKSSRRCQGLGRHHGDSSLQETKWSYLLHSTEKTESWQEFATNPRHMWRWLWHSVAAVDCRTDMIAALGADRLSNVKPNLTLLPL